MLLYVINEPRENYQHKQKTMFLSFSFFVINTLNAF